MASEAFIALLALLSSFFSLFFRKPRRRRLPPGPKPWPLLGNVTDLRPKELWLLATDWAKRYGPFLSVFLRSSFVRIVNLSQAMSYTCTSLAKVSSS